MLAGPEITTTTDCQLGKYGVIISLAQQSPQQGQQPDSEEPSPLTFKEISHALGQHIVGMNPKTVGCTEEDKPAENKDDEDKLLFQEFLLDPSVSVGELLKSNGAVVNTFVRFACGEELPHDEKDS